MPCGSPLRTVPPRQACPIPQWLPARGPHAPASADNGHGSSPVCRREEILCRRSGCRPRSRNNSPRWHTTRNGRNPSPCARPACPQHQASNNNDIMVRKGHVVPVFLFDFAADADCSNASSPHGLFPNSQAKIKGNIGTQANEEVFFGSLLPDKTLFEIPSLFRLE